MSNSPASLATVAMIFRSLRGRFGTAFVDRYRSGSVVPDGQPNAGKDTGLLEAMAVWAHELRGLSAAEIQRGVEAKFKFPPSCDEFVQACCRDVDYAALHNEQFKALPAPTLTREEAAQRMAQVQGAARSARFPIDNRLRLDWAYAIAEETARGVYHGGIWLKRIAALAIESSRKPVPESLRAFLPKSTVEAEA